MRVTRNYPRSETTKFLGPRCEKAAIPEASCGYRSKTQVALPMLETALQRGIDFSLVGVDGDYGKEPALLRAVDRLGLSLRGGFVADVHSCDQRIYLQDHEPRNPLDRGAVNHPAHSRHRTRPYRWISERHHNRPMPGND